MFFPQFRARRIRGREVFRNMVRETSLSSNDLIYPMFSAFGKGIRKEISSMPGIYQQSIENIVAGTALQCIVSFVAQKRVSAEQTAQNVVCAVADYIVVGIATNRILNGDVICNRQAPLVEDTSRPQIDHAEVY